MRKIAHPSEEGASYLFASARELGDRFGALRDGMLGEFTRKDKADRGLDFAGGDGGFLGVGCEFGSLASDPFKDIVHEGVENGHGLVGDTSVRVYLLKYFVDVRRVGLLASLLAGLLLLTVSGDGSLLGGLLGCLVDGLSRGLRGGSRGGGFASGGSGFGCHWY